jgi:hypothetical protein
LVSIRADYVDALLEHHVGAGLAVVHRLRLLAEDKDDRFGSPLWKPSAPGAGTKVR